MGTKRKKSPKAKILAADWDKLLEKHGATKGRRVTNRSSHKPLTFAESPLMRINRGRLASNLPSAPDLAHLDYQKAELRVLGMVLD